MSKRRTRKEKEKAKHPFLIKWEPEEIKVSKGKSASANKNSVTHRYVKKNKTKKDNSYFLTGNGNLNSIKHEIFKSLFLTGIILGLEIILYLAKI